MKDDLDHLRLLAIFHYVVAGLYFLCACFPLIHLAVGIGIVSGAFGRPQVGEPPPEFIGWLFILLSVAFIVTGWAFAICLAVAGRLLQRQRGYMFCLVMAALACVLMPIGTILGVFTLVVLVRPSVKELFGRTGDRATLEEKRSCVDFTGVPPHAIGPADRQRGK
jgi:hypothetical protein